MRNLKKILALALALVMSLSLMATASAAGTSAAGTNDYTIAQQVLEGLEVFIGDEGGMRYDASITRAETAALVYRIATSDVKDTQKDLYTNHPFNDVLGTTSAWANGYIAYGYNAEILKGNGDGTFTPGANVTGYQVLAMILRTMGYGRNHEFEGANWEIQTAATAKQEGLLNGVTAADEAALGQPAPRGLVAQILFNALLQPTVKFNVNTPYNYVKDAETLGYQKFTLEEVVGVVVANEYAGILRGENVTTGKEPTASNKTVLRKADGSVYEIDTATGLDDLGMTRKAYTTKASSRNNYNMQCLALIDPGTDYVVYDGGEYKDNLNGLRVSATETERYLNFGESTGDDTLNIKVSYVAYRITDTINGLDQADAVARFIGKYGLSAAYVTVGDQLAVTATYAGSGSYRIVYTPKDSNDVALGVSTTSRIVEVLTDKDGRAYYRVQLAPNTTYGSVDEYVISSIFKYAGLTPESMINMNIQDVYIEEGEVYRGTQFVTDYSDTHSYEEFLADCVTVSPENINSVVNGNEAGWWLKVIDNDNDGVSEWVFQTRYTVAKVSSVADDGALTLDTPNSGIAAKDALNRGGNNAGTSSQLNSESSWGGSNHEYNDNINSTKRNSNGTTTASNESGESLAVGDVVYFAYIDDANYAWKSDVVEARVSSINRSALTVTLDNGDVYDESAVHEHSTSTDIISGVTNMSGTTSLYLYLDRYNNVAAFSQNITGNLVLLVDGWAKSVISGTEYAARIWNKDTQSIDQYDIATGGSLFIDGTNYSGDGANSWNRIRRFTDLNDTGNHIRTMVAYLESNGDNNALVPVDTVWDVQRLNDRPVAMIDLGTTVPGNQPVNGTIWQTSALSVTRAYDNKLNETVNVRALSNTMYYYVWNTGYGVSVTQFEGYASGARFVDSEYIEDVYAVGTYAEDVNGKYYTANVVVIELNDRYRSYGEEVFIYNMPVVGTGATIEEVEAIGENGELRTIKVDITASRTYTEATGTAGSDGLGNGWNFTPGLYWVVRTSRTDAEDIWAVVPMYHDDIRESGHYDVGDIVTSYDTLTYNYAQVRNYVCGDYTDGDLTDNHAALKMIPDPDSYRNTPRRNTDNSKYYTLSYNGSTSASFGTATASTASNVLRQWFNPGNTSDLNHNQVLVRYDGSGNIVYAVSFDHQYNNAENYAQQVWRGVTLDRFEAPVVDADVTFYNAEDTDGNHSITVPYAEAKAYVDSNPNAKNVVVSNGTYTLVDAANNQVVDDATLSTGEKVYYLYVNNNSVTTPWTLTQLAASGDNVLRYADGTVVPDPIPASTTDGNLISFILSHVVPTNAEATWTLTDRINGQKYTVVVKNGEVIGNNLPNTMSYTSEVTDDFAVTVVAENGAVKTYGETGETVDVTVTFTVTGATISGDNIVDNKAEVPAGTTVTFTVTAENEGDVITVMDGDTPVPEVNGVYSIVASNRTIIVTAAPEDPEEPVERTVTIAYVMGGTNLGSITIGTEDFTVSGNTLTLSRDDIEYAPSVDDVTDESGYVWAPSAGDTTYAKSGDNYVITFTGETTVPDVVNVTVTITAGDGNNDIDSGWNEGPAPVGRAARTLSAGDGAAEGETKAIWRYVVTETYRKPNVDREVWGPETTKPTIFNVTNVRLYSPLCNDSRYVWIVEAEIESDYTTSTLDLGFLTMATTEVPNQPTPPDDPTDELLTYRAAKTGDGNTTYEFYGYQDKVVLTEDEAKTALAVALSSSSLTLTKDDISIADNGLTAWYKDANGTTQTVGLVAKGAAGTYGHWTATEELFAVSYKDEVIYYAYTGETGIVFDIDGVDKGFVAYDNGGKIADNYLAVENGKTEALGRFAPEKDVALVDVMKVTTSSGRLSYKQSDNTWTQIDDKDVNYVVSGTEVRFWITTSVVGDPIEDKGQYRVAINDTTFKTMSGTEAKDAAEGKSGVVVEIGTLTADMAADGEAVLTIKRVYDINLDSQFVGTYADGEVILVGDYGLEEDDVVMAPSTTSKLFVDSNNSTNYKFAKVAADKTHDGPYLTFANALIDSTCQPKDGKTVNLYSTSMITWPKVAGKVTVSLGDEKWESETTVDFADTSIRKGATLTVTSSDVNKMFLVKVGDADAVGMGTPSSAAKTEITLTIGDEPVVITEMNAARPVYVRLLNGSNVPGSTVAIEGTRLDVFDGDDANSATGVSSSAVSITIEKIGSVDEYRPGPGTTFEGQTNYKVTAKGIEAANGYTFAGLTGGDIRLVNSLSTWTLQTAVVTVNPDGTLDLELTLYSGNLT